MIKKQIKIGIIITQMNRADVISYRNELIEVNKKLQNKIKLIIFGYKQEDDFLEGVGFEYVKPTSIIHYPKQLKALNLDLLLIPLRINTFNQTSEDYNKYMEAAIFKIPILAPNITPYNMLIQDGINGFLFNNKAELPLYIEQLAEMQDELDMVGQEAHSMVNKNMIYNNNNNQLIENLFNNN